MDLVVNHTSDEHPWFVESRSGRTARAATGTGGARPPGPATGRPGGGADELGLVLQRPGVGIRSASGEYYLHLFSRKQPDLNWRIRRPARGVRHDALVAGPRVDGFRMDVINMISKDTSLPDGAVTHGVLGDGSPYFQCGPRIHEFLREMHEEVFAGRPGRLLTVGEMPGVTVDEAVLFTDPDRHEVDMVFQFEHVSLDQGPGGKWDLRPLRLLDLKASLGRWQAGLAERGWNSLYWDNHDQPRAVSRFGDDGRHRVESAKLLATVLHLHRGTPYIYQGEELGMTNAPFAGPDDFRDIESVNHYRAAVAAARIPSRCSRRCAGRAGTMPGPPCNGMPGPVPDSPRADRGSRSIPIMSRSMPPPRSTIRIRCSPITARSSPCGTPSPPSRTATSRCCCPTIRRLFVHPAIRVDHAARGRQFLRATGRGTGAGGIGMGRRRTRPGQRSGGRRPDGHLDPAATLGGARLPAGAVTHRSLSVGAAP